MVAADAPEALTVFGDEAVTRWLSPAMDRVSSVDEMAATISGGSRPPAAPAGRWAVTPAPTASCSAASPCCRSRPSRRTSRSAGSSTRRSGAGYAAEAGHAVAHHAFEAGVDELFAVVRPRNTRGARTATSIGMEWVGETEKYYDLRLQVYRLRKGELDVRPTTAGAGPPRGLIAVQEVRVNDVGDVVLEDVRQLRALADQDRLAVFTRLQRHGSADVAELATGLDRDIDAVAAALESWPRPGSWKPRTDSGGRRGAGCPSSSRTVTRRRPAPPDS